MRILGIIPARYASTRFPGKPLIDLRGKTMIQRVYEQCVASEALTDVVVATDDQRIYEHVEAIGGKAMMTASNHQTGTARCAEVVNSFDEAFDYAINIQGDEPFIQPSQIDKLAALLDGETQLATLVKQSESAYHIRSKNTVKVVFNKDMEAMYFSRETIPHLRDINADDWHLKGQHYLHIGIYAYRVDVLQEIVQLAPAALELNESLEQLRWLWNGYKIKVGLTDIPSYGIDSPEDIEPLLSMFLD